MSTIRAEDGHHTLFNIFHTDGPGDQQRLFDQWRSLPPGHTQPGLIAGNFHRGFDGRSVINYAQWESKEAYDAFISETATQRRLNESLSFSDMENLPCQVVYTGNPAPELSLEKPWFTVVIVVTVDPERSTRPRYSKRLSATIRAWQRWTGMYPMPCTGDSPVST
jgi:hypothetical protein